MAGGLVGLFDDVAALAKLAAASVDDVGAAAGRASVKAAGVVVDDAAVTPAYVRGLAADRELPIIKRIAIGSLRNKLLFILPVALLLSAIAPTLVEIILMFGGCFLAYEGAHKVIHALRHDDHDHDVPAVELGPDAEATTDLRRDPHRLHPVGRDHGDRAQGGASTSRVVSRAVILAVVGVLITVVVYGVVALIVKMDDVGLKLAERPVAAVAAGRPAAGDRHAEAAGLAVGDRHRGHALGRRPHPAGRLRRAGLDAPYDLVHDLEELVHDVPGIGGVLALAGQHRGLGGGRLRGRRRHRHRGREVHA